MTATYTNGKVRLLYLYFPASVANGWFRFTHGDLIPGKMTQVLLPKYFEKLFVILFLVVIIKREPHHLQPACKSIPGWVGTKMK